MSAGKRKLLAKILDRVAEPGEQTNAVFLFDEVLRWPPNAITGLGAAKLLKEIMPADAITCYECDERCRRPVTLIEGAHLPPAERAQAGNALAHIGDPRQYVTQCDTMHFQFDGSIPYKQVGAFYWESRTVYVGLNYMFGGGKNKALQRKQRDANETQSGGGLL